MTAETLSCRAIYCQPARVVFVAAPPLVKDLEVMR